MDHFWMVFTPSGCAPKFQHSTEKEAECEARRLAAMNPGQTFYVLQAIGKARKVDVEFTRFDNVPF